MFASRPLALLLLCAIACDEDPVRVVPRPPSLGKAQLATVTWEHPLPQGNDLRRLWGFPDGSFYAVGEAGTILRYDGSSFSLADTPTRGDLHGIWAGGPADVFAAGFGGILIHYDGLKWSVIHTPTQSDFYAVWASSPADVFLADGGGSVWNYTNGSWAQYMIAPGKRFRALWGYGHNEVYVAGSNATIYKFDGATWTRILIGTNPNATVEIRDLWGPGPGTFSLVAGSSIAWFDGVSWRAESVIATSVYGQWGFDFDNQVTVSAGLSTHWVDGAQSWYPTPTPEPLFDVWGRATDDYYAVGRFGNVAHFDGNGWAALNSGSFSNLADIVPTPSGFVAVGSQGAVLRRTASTWIEEVVPAGYDLAGVWESVEGLAIAVGRFSPDEVQWRQAILMNTGAGWVDTATPGTAPRLFDVWGSSSDDVFAVGWGGEILHYNGATWSVVSEDAQDVAFLHSVTGTSASSVFAVGRTNDLNGLVMNYDGAVWRSSTIPSTEELYGVYAESMTAAFAVGSLGSIFQYDGTSWKSMPSPTDEALFCVWGFGSSDVYAAGWDGSLIHFDGTSWRRLLISTNRNLRGVVGDIGSGDLLLVGDRGAIINCPSLN